MTRPDVHSTVGEWVAEHPQSARIFEDYGIDYCCGGETTLADACGQKNLDAAQVEAELARAAADPPDQPNSDWSQCSLTELCDHIQETHHAFLRSELPRLQAIIDKVVDAHGQRHPETNEVRVAFAELRAELEPHIVKEEGVLFPAICSLEAVPPRPLFPFGTVADPIRMMEHEHEAAGATLKKIRRLTQDFLPPDDACNTYRVMLDGLHRLEIDMHTHIHKENNILFPRAQKLESTLNQAESDCPGGGARAQHLSRRATCSAGEGETDPA